MKSFAVAVVGLASLASSYPDSYQQEPCTCAEAETITITEPYHSTETSAPGQYSPGKYYADNSNAQYGPEVTITVTETAAAVTITNAVTVTESATYGGSYGTSVVTVTAPGVTYTNQPPSPPNYSATSAVYSNATSTSHGARQTHRVEVGTFDGKVQFVPDRVDAEIGDVVEYDFLVKSHSLTQSEFLTPCTYNGGFDTGLNQLNPKNQSGLFVIPFEVKTKRPLWFYCKQPGPPNHCGLGMVMGINPGNKMDQFIKNAINQNGNSTAAASSTRGYATATSTSTTLTSTATGSVTTVTVGLMNGTVLKFSPPYLPKVSVGEKIHFDFRAANHTLTESSLYNPCTKLEGTDVDTNFQNVNKADIPELKPFDLTIDSDKPRFFYCKQANHTPKGHCSHGMVFAINTDEATFGQFEKNAIATLPRIKGRFAA